MKRTLVIVLFFTSFWVVGQNSYLVDSLTRELAGESCDSLKCKLLIRLSSEYLKGNLDSSLIFVSEALDIAKELEDQRLITKAMMEMGSVHILKGFYKPALENLLSALDYYEQIRDSSNIYKVYVNIGAVYDYLKDTNRARQYYIRGLELAEVLVRNDSSKIKSLSLALLYNNVGTTWRLKGKPEKAIEYYYKALEIAKKTGDLRVEPFAYNNIGNLYMDKKEYEIALSFYEKALQIREKNSDLKGNIRTYEFMGTCYRNMNKYDQALVYLKKAFEIAQKTQSLHHLRELSSDLAGLYAESGNYSEAYNMHKRYKKLNDSLSTQENINAAIQLDMQYQFNKVNKEQILRHESKKFRYLLTISIMLTVSMLFVLLALLSFNRSKRAKLANQKILLEKENLQIGIEIKNKELAVNVLNLVSKNELISNVISRLIKIRLMLKKESLTAMNEIITDLQLHIDDTYWEEFEKKFKDVHVNFYENLYQRHPDLTNNEKKLCSFLRIGMNTKWISQITFQTPHSVDVARTRLRKKLELVNSDLSLEQYLLQF